MRAASEGENPDAIRQITDLLKNRHNLGRGASLAVRTFLGWPTELSLSAIVAAVVVSVVVGDLFGFNPAYRASKLDPIEALRYE